MSSDKMIQAGLEMLRARCSGYRVDIEPTPDDAAFFEATVYGVEELSVEEVTRHIHDVDREVFRPRGALLVPMVVDVEDTREYYPAVHDALCTMRLQALLEGMADIITSDAIDRHVDLPFEPQTSEEVKVAADGYLPLAA